MSVDLLQRIIAETSAHKPFAILYRPHDKRREGRIEVFVGEMEEFEALASLPLPKGLPKDGAPHEDVLFLAPYRQLRERGFACIDDGAPLLAMTIGERQTLSVARALTLLPTERIAMAPGEFDIDDESYATLVGDVISGEIEKGEGSNFVIKRTFEAQGLGDPVSAGLSAFRRLLQDEVGAYWTFVLFTGSRVLVGASPERQISLEAGVATINPISGTYRYPASGPTLAGAVNFLSDVKERDELYMVVDEELKMMARFCPQGGTIRGPFLKEMSRLAHTEYMIEGHTRADPREVIVGTMFAPTVTGSPIENACRVITRHERKGRGYYAGIVGLFGRSAAGDPSLDSAILIRTAEIAADGRIAIGVGASIVRHSDPAAEALETQAKAKALLAAFGLERRPKLAGEPAIQSALSRRNETISNFWLTNPSDRIQRDSILDGRSALVIDAEDAFTEMLAQQLSALGLAVTMRKFDDPAALAGDFDVTVMGPGPGDPRNMSDNRISLMRSTISRLLEKEKPFLAVCLSHQLLCLKLGLKLIRRAQPNQGIQKEIEFFGRTEAVGFYNSYIAQCAPSRLTGLDGGVIEVCRDPTSFEVHALRGEFFSSMQFHAESLLTQNGPAIICESIRRVLPDEGAVAHPEFALRRALVEQRV